MKKDSQSSLHERLKSQTIELHKQAHKIPYITNLLNNDIHLKSYIGHLRAFSIIYEALENQILEQENDFVNDYLDEYSPRTALLKEDLEYLSTGDFDDNMQATKQAENVVDKILEYCKTNPYKLLGFIYTLEGSINGGSILKQHIERTFNFENNQGTMYLSCLDDRFNKFWAGFIDSLNTKITEEKHKDEVISAANEMFVHLMQVYKSL